MGQDTAAPPREACPSVPAAHDYRALLERLDDGFCVIEMLLDPDGRPVDYRFLEANPAFTSQAGLGEVVGRRMRELAPAHEQHWFDLYGAVARTGEPVRFVHHAQAPDARWFDVQAFRIGDAAARQVAVLFRDISERMQVEVALMESEARLRQLADASPAILWTADRTGTCVFHSERWYAYSGQPVDDPPAAVADYVHPDDRPRVAEAWARALADGSPYEVETRLRRRDGAWRWFLVRAFPRRDGLGRTLGWNGSSTDIHEHKRIEQALRLSEQRMSVALDVAQLGTWVFDQADGTVEADARCREICGLDPHAPLDLAAVAAQVHPDDWPCVQAALDAALAPGSAGEFSAEIRWLQPDGSMRWTLSRGQVLRADADPRAAARPLRLIGSALDVSARHRTEEELRDASRRKDEFLATLAHELRNPLAPLGNCLRLLGAEGADQERLRAVMERQVAQLGRLVDDLLEVSRITRGSVPLQRAPVTLEEIVQRAVETSQPLIDAAGHRLTVALPAAPLLLVADPARLAQVLANLLNNAAKYTEPGGAIALQAWREGETVVIVVRDTGIGIAAEELPRVFDLFAQVDGGLARAQGGLGIGLTLVRRLVALHGGSVRACSDGIGRGSTFEVRLPLPPLPPRKDAAAGVAGEAGPDAPLRLLVVDDNRDHADTLALFLRLAGHEVQVAYDGHEGLAAAARFRPDAVLLDVGMPRLDGYAACRRLRAQPGGAAVVLVALTGWGQDEDRRRSREAGFDAHLVKPADPAALLARVGALVRLRAGQAPAQVGAVAADTVQDDAPGSLR